MLTGNDEFVFKAHTQTLTNKTLTTPKIAAIAEAVDTEGVTIDSLLVKDGDIPNARLNTKVIKATRDLTAASGDVEYSGVGFMPTALICIGAIGSADNAFWGISDSDKTDKYMKRQGGTFGAPGDNYLINVEPVSNNWQIATVKSYNADGFTLTWTKSSSPTGTLTMMFLCFR